MEAVLSAVVAGDWSLALDHALVVWRATRDPALADLIDRITAKLELPAPTGRLPAEDQLWWVLHGRDHASRPDPIVVGGLLAVIGHRADFLDAAIEAVRTRWVDEPRTLLTAHLGTGNAWPTNFQERVAALLRWPDDPRVARTIVEIAASTAFPHAYGIPAMYDLLAARVGEIGDVRGRDKLAEIAAEPRAGQEVLRRLQATFATRALAVLDERELPGTAGPLVADCLALLPVPPPPAPPPPRLQIEALWREVAAHPDDVGVRAVLGDALVEAGDLRGDVIVLQCNARVPNRPLRGGNRSTYDGRVKTLLRMQWEAWFGDLALILPRRACEFRCGMLEVVTVGLASSPEWAFAKAKGHRELACVHTVRPGWVTTANYVAFVRALPRLPKTLGATGMDVIEALTDHASLDGLETLELTRSPVTGPNNTTHPDWTSKPLREGLARLAVLAPGVKELIVRDHVIARLFAGLRRDVRLLFPALRRLAVDKHTAITVSDLVDDNTFTVA